MKDIFSIRKIQLTDNLLVAKIIREALTEFGGNRPGTAYFDPETDNMFEAYQKSREVYYVALRDGKVVGGCGIKPLKGGNPEICELQKLYLLSETRGLGIGSALVEWCLDFAKQNGYLKCYLETFPNMLAAISLYLKVGFIRLKAPIGETGHNGCDVWMQKEL